jgi:hypothetical protein
VGCERPASAKGGVMTDPSRTLDSSNRVHKLGRGARD